MAAPKKSTPRKVCLACDPQNAEKPIKNFYASHNPMHKDNKLPWCKDCIIKNSVNENNEIDEAKFLSVLRQLDKPFYKDILRSATAQYLKERPSIPEDKIKLHGDKIIGLYMKNLNSLRQLVYKNYSDSENSGFYFNEEERPSENSVLEDETIEDVYLTPNIPVPKEELIFSKTWYGKYTQSDIDYLDTYYAGLERDYKIITENHRDYARKIAKASLQMDKAFTDVMANVQGADSRYKSARENFDVLSKSAKFSESTRSVNDVGISGYAKISELVESHNWIPTHKPVEKDEVDEILEYLRTIKKSV